VVTLWTTTELYRVLLDSAASEHSARYQLMEGATQNANRLIDELALALQAVRQQAITAEMQELAVGAGLLGSEEE
jgi:F-type H+-transporting ATPase subunit gamma